MSSPCRASLPIAAGHIQKIGDVIRDGKRRRQARRFDPEQIDEAADSVIVGPLNDEVAGGLSGRLNLRSDPRVAGLDRAVAQCRIIFSDSLVEHIGTPGIHVVIDLVDPFDIGTEPDLPAEVDRDVNAEAGFFRNRVDRTRKGRLADQRIVVALGVIGRRDELRVESREALISAASRPPTVSRIPSSPIRPEVTGEWKAIIVPFASASPW